VRDGNPENWQMAKSKARIKIENFLFFVGEQGFQTAVRQTLEA
jgi:hypothetical protein